MSRTLKDMSHGVRERRRRSVIERERARRRGRRGLVDVMTASAETTTRGHKEVKRLGRFRKEVPT